MSTGLRRREDDGLLDALRATNPAAAVAEHNAERALVLGAWGCGAFRNDAAMVAATARSVLRSPRFDGIFERVVFAIPGKGERSLQNLGAFRKVFGV
jgi:uncharacterized protein (TIGR02452 family)